jgi:hypothetical protein
MSWGSSNSTSMGDSNSLGKANSDWKLPPASASASEASPDKGDIWKSPAPASAYTADTDNSTVTTWASTISNTENTLQGMQPETVHSMRMQGMQPATVSMQTETPTVASSITGDGTHNNNPNPYKGMASFRLNKTGGVPKAALHSVYGRPPRRKVISQENYYTWHNSGPPHLLKFTSIFCCPLTGECFASGRYGDAALYQHTSATATEGGSINVIWYNKKTLAEHGAAARAFDCIAHRECAGENAGDMIPESLGADVPYAYAQSPPFTSTVPDNIRQAIRQAQQGIFNNTSNNHSQGGDGSSKMEVDSAIDEGEELAWFSLRPPEDV